MLRVLAAAVVLVACTGDDEEGDPLGERVRAILDEEGEVTCPAVRAPSGGDRATCVLTRPDGAELEVDVEFADDGSVTVVAEVPR